MGGVLRLSVVRDREDDGRHIAEVPTLPGVLAYGATVAEADAAVRKLALSVLSDRGFRGAVEFVEGTMPWWWLSFGDGLRSVGEQFLGAAMVDAPTFEDAVVRARVLGIAPAGLWDAAGAPLMAPPSKGYRRRLLSADDVEQLHEELGGVTRWSTVGDAEVLAMSVFVVGRLR